MAKFYLLGMHTATQVQEMTSQPIFSPLLVDLINGAIVTNDVQIRLKPSFRRFISEHTTYLLDAKVVTEYELLNSDPTWVNELVCRLNHRSHLSLLIEYISSQVHWLASKQSAFFWASLIEKMQEGHTDFTWFGTEQLVELELQEFHPLAICNMWEEHGCPRRFS